MGRDFLRQPLAVGEGMRERFLEQDMLAGSERIDRHRRVQKIGRADADSVDVGASEHLTIVVEDLRAIDRVLRLDLLGEVRVDIRQRGDPCPGVLLVPLDVPLPRPPNPDDPNPYFVHVISSFGPRFNRCLVSTDPKQSPS
jgi:hypothetical protein